MTVGTVKTLSKSICIKNEFLKTINQAEVALTWNYQTTNVSECFFWEATENSANNNLDEQ